MNNQNSTPANFDPTVLRDLKDLFKIREVAGGYEIYDGLSEDLVDYVVPDCVVSIGENAFSEFDSLETLTIPKTVRHIDTTAFDGYNCPEVINLSLSCELVNDLKSRNYGFQDIIDPGDICNLNVSFDPNITVIPQNLFSYTGITVLDLRNASVQTIEDSAFASCSDLEKIYFGDTVSQISDTAFENCSYVEEVCLTHNCPLGIRALHDIFDVCEITRE